MPKPRDTVRVYLDVRIPAWERIEMIAERERREARKQAAVILELHAEEDAARDTVAA